MTTYEALNLMVMFSVFVISLISLIVGLTDNKKGKK